MSLLTERVAAMIEDRIGWALAAPEDCGPLAADIVREVYAALSLPLSWEARREAETRRCVDLARSGMSNKEIAREVGVNAGRVGKLLELSGYTAERAADRTRRVRDAVLGIARGETYAAAARRVGVSLESVRHAAHEALSHRGRWREPCPDCGTPDPVPWGGRCEPRVRAFLEREDEPR